MTAKRFEICDVDLYEYGMPLNEIMDNGVPLSQNQVCELLNELHEENQQYKALLQDMGLLMSDEDVMCIRTEIADKFIKQLYKENGFDVDVDCTNGFTIIPKGDGE